MKERIAALRRARDYNWNRTFENNTPHPVRRRKLLAVDRWLAREIKRYEDMENKQ